MRVNDDGKEPGVREKINLLSIIYVSLKFTFLILEGTKFIGLF